MKHLDFNQMMDIKENKVVANEDLVLINHVHGDEFDILLDTSLLKVMIQVLAKNKYAFVIIFLGTLLISYLQYRIRKAKVLFTEMYERDSLTDTYNRRAGMKYLSHLIDEIQITRDELCIVFIDVDGLKQINDGLGHEYGDDLLTTITFVVKEEIREKDLLFRLGGDEFLLALMDNDVYIAEKIMSRIQSKLDSINENDEKRYLLSFSYGISSTYELNTLDMEELIRISDERMYENKKNKVKRKMIKD
jgi:diguanylate cyclase (GGDEF)-like protein